MPTGPIREPMSLAVQSLGKIYTKDMLVPGDPSGAFFAKDELPDYEKGGVTLYEKVLEPFIASILDPRVKAGIRKEAFADTAYNVWTREGGPNDFIKNFNKRVFKYIHETYRSLPRGKEFLAEVHAEEYGFAPLSTQKIHVYVDSLSNEEMAEAFVVAEARGQGDILRALRANVRFNQIPPEAFSLVEVFISASRNGRVNVVRALMEDENFSTIPTDGRGFIVAFYAALVNRHADVIRTMMNSIQFREMNPVHIADAFEEAVSRGYSDLAAAITENERFRELHISCIGYGLRNAIRLGDQNMVDLIMLDPRYDELPLDTEYGLEKIFIEAAKSGRAEVVEVMMNLVSFENISEECIMYALEAAQEHRHYNIELLIVRRVAPELFEQIILSGMGGIRIHVILAAPSA